MPTLSHLSVGVLLITSLLGGSVSLHSLEVGITDTYAGPALYADPVFVVDLPMRPRNFAGFTLGCVIVIDSDRCQHERENILSHELNHVKQYKALGLFIVLAPIFIDIEGYSGGSIEERNSLMWSPPEGWIDLWHFLCVPIIPFVFILWSI